MKTVCSALVVALAMAIVPAAARAQSATTGAIAGVVRDTTGAVLPGVTVEAASPALIEKVRAAVTDSQGNYKIVDLRPGTYSVTFTLPGFSTFKREGIALTTGFTANASADMKIGSLEETVTVTGASPVVDVQNIRQQRVLTREVLDAVPTGKTLQGFAALTLGAAIANRQSQDVGGNQGEALGGFGIHGSKAGDQRLLFDGMQFAANYGSAQNRNIMVNQLFVEEVTLETRGISAQAESGGPQVNIVPKEGGNTTHYALNGSGTGPRFQSENLTDDLRARGLTAAVSVKKIYDVGIGVGGPIKQDTLWYYAAYRNWGSQNYAPGSYYNRNQGNYVGSPNSGVTLFEPDPARPGYLDLYNQDGSVRFTWQMNSRNKFNFNTSLQRNCNCNRELDLRPVAPEATLDNKYWPIVLSQATWSNPRTNKLLFEAGWTYLYNSFEPARQPEVKLTDIAITEQSTGLDYNAKADGLGGSAYNSPPQLNDQANGRFSVSYVTGSHAFKAGFTLLRGTLTTHAVLNDPPLHYFFLRGVPVSLQEWASPLDYESRIFPNLGVFGQDQWTIHRMTLNLGVRYDRFAGNTQPADLRAGAFVPARSLPGRSGTPQWSDLSPRVGVSFDVFGNGKTAVKGSIGRYLELGAIAIVQANAPPNAIATNATRTWSDANGNYVPDCNLLDAAANGECGRSSTAALGQPITVVRYADDVLNGFGNRAYNWQTNLNLLQEVLPNVGLQAGYYRTWYGNFSVTDNLAVQPSDYDSYCVTAPADARLGGASGHQFCGLFDLNPARLGQVSNLITHVSNYGTRTEVYNGFEAGLNARFGKGGLLQGGMATGRTVEDNCVVVDSPQVSRPDFCKIVTPFKGQTQYKLAGVYPLPFDLQISGTLQNLPGIPIAANYTVASAQVASSLGRNLSLGSATVPLLVPNTQFEDRLTQVDLRFTKILKFGHARAQAMFDVYNLFNAATVLGENPNYGAAWLRPTAILGGRLLKFGGQINF